MTRVGAVRRRLMDRAGVYRTIRRATGEKGIVDAYCAMLCHDWDIDAAIACIRERGACWDDHYKRTLREEREVLEACMSTP